MADRALTGAAAEEAAYRHLKRSGLRLRERNYRHRRGEIDLIMEHGDELVFVEVRCRNSDRYGSAAESVDHHKQARLISTALAYLQQHGLNDNPARFDVVAMKPNQTQPVEWIQNAFQIQVA